MCSVVFADILLSDVVPRAYRVFRAHRVEPNRAAHQAYLRGLISRLGSDEALFRRVYRYAFIVGKEPGQKALGLENAIIYWQMLFSPEPPGWAWRSGRAGAVSDTAMASADAAETPTGTPTTTGSRRGKRSSTSSAAATSSATQQSPSSSSRRQQSQSHVIDWLSLWTSYLQERWTRSVSRDMWNQTFEFALRSVKDPTLSFWSEDGAWPGVIDDFVVWYRKNASADETAAGAMEVDEAGGGGR